MAFSVNPINFATDDLAAFLAKPTDDGTWNDVITTLKVDRRAVRATRITKRQGQLWSNLIDSFVHAAWPLLRQVAQGVAGESLAATLLIGNTTGARDILVDNGQAVAWRDGTPTTRMQVDLNSGEPRWRFFTAAAALAATMAVATTTGTLSYDKPVSLLDPNVVLTRGVGTGSPSDVVDKSDAGTWDQVLKVAGSTRWTLRYAADEDIEYRRHDGSGVFVDIPFAIDWQSGLATFANNVTLSGTSPTLVIGSGAGQPVLLQAKADGSTAHHQWLSGGNLRWQFFFDANEDFFLGRYNASGVFQSFELVFPTAGGVQLTNVVATSNVALDSANPVLTVGNATGLPQLSLNRDTTSQSILGFKAEGLNDWAFANQNNNSLDLIRYIAGVFQEVTLTFNNANGAAQAARDWTFLANVTLGSANPVLTLGNFGGNSLTSHKIGASTYAATEIRRTANREWDYGSFTAAALGTTNNGFVWRRFNNATDTIIDYPLFIDHVTGNVVMVNTLTVEDAIRVGTGTVPSGSAGALIFANGTFPALVLADNVSNLNQKLGFLGTPHYTNAEEPFLGLFFQADNGVNVLHIGGGTDSGNASTRIRFYTGANSTTLEGTQCAEFDSSGTWILGTNAGSVASQMRKSAASSAIFQFMTGSSDTANDKRFHFDSNETLGIQHYNGSAWVTILNMVGQNVFADGPSAIVGIGNATGNPILSIRKAPASTGELDFLTSASGTTLNDKRIFHDTDETLRLQHYNGSAWDSVLTVGNQLEVNFNGQFWSANTDHEPDTTVTIDWNDGNVHTIDLNSTTANVTVTLSNPKDGAVYYIVIEQDNASDWNITWPAAVKWENSSSAPTIPTPNDSVSLVRLVYYANAPGGAQYLASFHQNFGGLVG